MKHFYFRHLLPVIAMMLAGITASSAYDFKADDIYYNITSSTDLTVEVTYKTTYYNSYSGDVTIPNTVTNNGTTYTVTSIDSVAFYNCTNLASVTIGSSVTSIGNRAFCYCTSLASIEIPNSVTSIRSRAFCYCTSLTSIEIPDNVTSIGDQAFYECTSLKSVTIGNGVTSIEEGTFYKCSSLSSVAIGNSVTSIGSRAFSYCTSLASIEIPDSVTSIEERAFSRCTSLSSVKIGNSVTSIGGNAFRYCTSLKSVIIPNNVTELSDSVFYKCSALKDVTIPAHLTEKAYSTSLIGCDSITSVTISGSGEIGGSAFTRCTTLTTLVIGDSVTSIGDSAFYKCTGLSSVIIGNSVTSIGSRAFCYCTSLSSIEIPNSVTSIDSVAFSRCTSLASIEIPNSVTSIGDNAFYYCTSLRSVTIPDSVNIIEHSTFYNCTSLASVTIPNSVNIIEHSAFYNCTSLASVTIPNSVTSIGYRAFYKCTSLASVTIGNSVKSIEKGVFGRCTSLQSIYCMMEDVSSVECGDTVFLWADNGVKNSTIVRNAVLFVPDEGALQTYRAADQWKDFERIAVTRYMDEGETIAAGEELNITSTTTSSSTTESIKTIAETTGDEDSESNDSESAGTTTTSETLYVVVTFGSDEDEESSADESSEETSVWSAAEEEETLDVVGPFSYYVTGNVAAENESGDKYDPTSDDNNSFDAPVSGAYLMMEPKADGTIYVAVKQQGDVYVCDETGTTVDYLAAELPNGVFEYYGSSSDVSDTEETSEPESTSDTEETTTATCARYSFPALAGKTYFVTSTSDNCLNVAGYAFEPADVDDPFKANTLTISDSSEDNLTESSTITNGQYDVTLTRNFYKGGWTSMVLPFSVSPSMLKEAFGDDAAIIYFNKVDDDVLYLTEHYHQMIVTGTPMFIRPDITATSLTFKGVTYGEPTLSYSSDNGTYSVTSQTLPSIVVNIIGCEDNTSGWKLTGSYIKTTTSDHVYMIGFTMSDTDNDGTDDTVADNNFYEYTSAQSISGMRAWLYDSTDDSSASSIKSVFNGGVSDDSETTGIINALMGEGTATGRSDYGNGNIYNLNGQMARRAGEGTVGLPAGIYVVNGRKVAVK